jgi:excisionase family DNA binding protein
LYTFVDLSFGRFPAIAEGVPNRAKVVAMSVQARHLLTAKEVAERLGVGLRTVWRWTATGELPAPVRRGSSGRIVRWKVTDIERFVRDLPVQSRPGKSGA